MLMQWARLARLFIVPVVVIAVDERIKQKRFTKRIEWKANKNNNLQVIVCFEQQYNN